METKHIVLIAVAVLAVLALPLVAARFMGGSDGAASAALEKEYERIRSEGEPLTGEELNAWYATPPDGQNAAVPFGRAFAVYVEPMDRVLAGLPLTGDADWPPRGERFPATTVGVIQTHCENNAATLEFLYEGAEMSGCRYPTDLRKLAAAELPHLSRVRRCTQLLCEQAVLLAATEDCAGSVHALSAAVAMAESMQEEPLLISQLVRVASLGYVFETLSRVLSTATLADDELSHLSAAIATVELGRGFHRAYMGERVLNVSADSRIGPGLEALLAEPPADGWEQSSTSLIQDAIANGTFDRGLLFAVNTLRGMIAAADKPPAEAAALFRDLEQDLTEAPDENMVEAMCTPLLFRGHQARLRGAALCRLALTAVAVVQHQRAHGDVPTSLEDLVPEFLPSVPLDPYDGQPIRYRTTSEEFVVYSVSKNQRDDGGREEADFMYAWENGDLTFVVRL